MICAACGDPTETSPCAACGGEPLLAARWRLDRVLGRGANGTTYAGTHVVDGTRAALKEARPDAGAKAAALARREARLLREVRHPQLPRHVEELTQGTGKHATFWLVEELIEGQDLQAEAAGRRYAEADVLAVIAGLSPVLQYLHGLSPPVIHRDLKPRNVMRRPDGTLVLLDFGAAWDRHDEGLGGTTVAGTFGFMAPEQFRGEASPATDIYGLGALALALLSRRDPSSFAGPTGGLEWERSVTVSEPTRALLRRMLAPDPAARFPDVAALGRALRGEEPADLSDGRAWGLVTLAFVGVILLMFLLARLGG